MKRIDGVNQLLIRIFVPIIIIGMIINLVWPDKKMSNTENRSLQGFPEISVEEIMNGSFSKNMNNWYSDQFVGRDFFIHSKYVLTKMTGGNKIDDVYLGKKRLIEESCEMDREHVDRNLAAINDFFDKYPDLTHYFLMIPTAVTVQADKLPAYCDDSVQSKNMDYLYKNLSTNLHLIDVREDLAKKKDDYLYFKTDHHWTSLGAFYTAQVVNPIMGNSKISEDDFNVYTVSTNFKGTLAHRVGSVSMKDSIDIYVAKDNPDYIVTNVSTNEKSRSIYSVDDVDQYEVFLGGNAPCIRIETNNKNSEKHLLIFKDSYANAYIQFLLPFYRTITIVDPRYYTDSVDRIIRGDLITDVLYLYNTNTFMGDTSLADVLGG